MSTTVSAMSESLPQASVIVRTKDSAHTLGRVLSLLQAQTVPAEIIVVDSGSSDETLPMAHERADRVIEIDRFSFGYALNVGAAAARAPVHFALSSHAFPPDDHWIERSLSMYKRPDVAGTSGAPTLPGSSEPLHTTIYQTHAFAVSHPWWGFSNTGSSWRADVWRAFPFDEQLPACEDKEWGLRVLAAGWTIAIDSKLAIADAHRRRHGMRHLYRRARRESEAIGSFAPVPPFTIRGLLQQWLSDVPTDAPYRGWRRRLNYFRFIELVGKYHGLGANAQGRPHPTDIAASPEPPHAGSQDTADAT